MGVVVVVIIVVNPLLFLWDKILLLSRRWQFFNYSLSVWNFVSKATINSWRWP